MNFDSSKDLNGEDENPTIGMVETRAQVKKRLDQILNNKKEEDMPNINNESVGFIQALKIL